MVGGGDDLLWTTAGNDVFQFNAGDGQDWVTDILHDDAYFFYTPKDLAFYWKNQDAGVAQTEHHTQLLAGHDTLQFGYGIRPSEITLQRIDNHLVFSHANGVDRVVFANWFAANSNQLNRVEFADGTTWDAVRLQEMIANHAPVVNKTLNSQSFNEGSLFSYQLAVDSFTDADAGDSLTLSATLVDGGTLPDWLTFNANSQTFSGAPRLDAAGDYAIKVTAIDRFGSSAHAGFMLTIKDVNPEITGGISNDTLTGTEYADVINSGAGNDILIGGAGNDTLIAGTGSDWLQGGQGDDTLVLSDDARWSNRFIAFNAGSPGKRGTGERVSITAMQRSHDLFDGGEGFDTAQGTDGDDAVFLDDSFSPLPDGHGPRIKNIERFNMGAGDDIVDLTSQTYSYGDAEINGEAGNDTLWGSAGNDVLNGGLGDDKLTGGAGNDTYLFDVGDGHDQIRNDAPDYQTSTDTLRFGQGIKADDLWFERIAQNLKISLYQTGDDITIQNWYQHDSRQLDAIKLDEGLALQNTQIENLVNAMAAFNAPSGFAGVVPQEVREQLAPVIAASWTPSS